MLESVLKQSIEDEKDLSFPSFFQTMIFASFVLKLEFDDEWPFFLGFECNYFEYPSRFFERGRSRDCGARGRT